MLEAAILASVVIAFVLVKKAGGSTAPSSAGGGSVSSDVSAPPPGSNIGLQGPPIQVLGSSPAGPNDPVIAPENVGMIPGPVIPYPKMAVTRTAPRIMPMPISAQPRAAKYYA